jgi:hypothetical protein
VARPTRDQLAKAQYELESLAYDDDEVFHLLAGILNHAEWIRAELAHHKTQAGYKKHSEVGVIGTIGASSVEAQFAGHSTPTRMYRTDEMVKAAQKTRRRWVSQLTSQRLGMMNDAIDLGYPHRSEPEQWRVQPGQTG